VPGPGSFLEIIHVPELDCGAWERGFGQLPHTPGRRPGDETAPGQADNWIAADGAHIATRVRVFGSPAGRVRFEEANDRYDASWDDLAGTALREHRATLETYLVDEIELGAAPRPADAAFLYVVRMDVQPTAEEEFNQWYTLDHIANLSQVPGVYSARRYVASNAGPQVRRYLATYHLRCPSVRQTAAWQCAAHTDWSISIRRHHLRKLATMLRRTTPLPAPAREELGH
jgi:hypothetical protein